MTELPQRTDRTTPHYGALASETIVEVRQAGAWLSVAAVDSASGLEATATGPVIAGEDVLTRLALEKLSRLRRAAIPA